MQAFKRVNADIIAASKSRGRSPRGIGEVDDKTILSDSSTYKDTSATFDLKQPPVPQFQRQSNECVSLLLLFRDLVDSAGEHERSEFVDSLHDLLSDDKPRIAPYFLAQFPTIFGQVVHSQANYLLRVVATNAGELDFLSHELLKMKSERKEPSQEYEDLIELLSDLTNGVNDPKRNSFIRHLKSGMWVDKKIRYPTDPSFQVFFRGFDFIKANECLRVVKNKESEMVWLFQELEEMKLFPQAPSQAYQELLIMFRELVLRADRQEQNRIIGNLIGLVSTELLQIHPHFVARNTNFYGFDYFKANSLLRMIADKTDELDLLCTQIHKLKINSRHIH